MGMSSFAILALVAVIIQGTTIPNDVMQEGDKEKQEKVLELLDQYVLHVDRGRTAESTEVIDLLDQYVMHVDRGADVSLEEIDSVKHKSDRLDVGHHKHNQNHGYSGIVKKDKMKYNERNKLKNIKLNKAERDFQDKWKKLRPIERVRRNLRGVPKTENKSLVKPKGRFYMNHEIRAKRSLRKESSLQAEERSFKSQRSKREVLHQNKISYDEWESKPVHRSKRSIGTQAEDVVNESGFRQKRTAEVENEIDGSKEDTELELNSGLWTHSVKLHDLVTLSWKVLEGGNNIEFLMEAATTGYVGVGFSPGGGMAGSDIVLGWVDDSTGEAHLVDAYGLETSGAPVADPEQDCALVAGRQNDTHTVVRFRRALDTCDSNHDLRLGSDTVRLIWAIQETDPVLDGGELVGMTWHGKEHRGVRSLHLMTPPIKRGAARGPQTQHWDVTLKDFVVPDNMDTLYWCKIFKVPPLKRKHHMIGYEPMLQHGNERYVHHMLLYECVAPNQFKSPDFIFENYVDEPGAYCYSPTMPQVWDQCMTAIVAWAVGSQGEFLPNHVGLPLADGDKAKYFMLEIHYDNPEFRKVKDSSGIRIHYTEDLRQYDGGILVNGITITPLHIIPPHQPEYRTAGYCSSDCTHKMFPQTGIKLVSVVLHSHLAGKKLRLRHIRDGQELPRVAEDDHYDFNYQQARVLNEEVSVLPGDELVTECVYQTPNRTEPTFGGYSTKQEMCLAFVLYYPRTPLAACYSMTPVKYFFETFGVRQFYNVDMDTVESMFLKLPLPNNTQGSNRVSRSTTTTTTTTTSTTPSFPTGPRGALDEEANERAISVLKQMKDFTVEAVEGGGAGGLFGELVISEPDEFRNRSFTSHLVELPWTEKLLTQRVEESFYAGKHMVFCRKHDDQLAIPLAITTFPNFTELPEDNSKNKSYCEGKINHFLRVGNNEGFSSYNTPGAMFLLFTLLPTIVTLRQ